MDPSQPSSVLLWLKQLYGGIQPFQRIVDFTNGSFQQQVIEEILLSDHFLMFPPSTQRRRAFWKWIIEMLEREGEEVDERIYNAYVALLPESPGILAGPPSPCYSTRFWRETTNGQVCMATLLESQTTIESGTTGLRTWSASLALADWLIKHPETLQNRNILELGSGVGFLGLVIAQLQLNSQYKYLSTSLTLSDVNLEVLQRCRQNFLLPCNNTSQHSDLKFVPLDWSDALDQNCLDDPYSTLNQTLKSVDAVVGADLVYDIHIIPGLTAVLNLFFRLQKKEDNFALLAVTIRRQETVNAFIQGLIRYSLVYEEIDTTDRTHIFDLEIDNQEWKLFRIQRIRLE